MIFFYQDKWSNITQKINNNNKKNGGSALFVYPFYYDTKAIFHDQV
jgi:hypothetical protein